MIYLTMKNGGGNHGHQLFDLIGTLTIARVFGFTYVHHHKPYLDFSGVHIGELTESDIDSNMERVMVTGNKHLRNCFSNFSDFTSFPPETHDKIINYDLAKMLLEKSGRSFDHMWRIVDNCPVGIDEYETVKQIFEPIQEKYADKDCLVVLDCLRGSSIRILPHQALKWYNQGLLDKNVFDGLTTELNKKYMEYWNDKETYLKKDEINVSMHIGRGRDYNHKFINRKPNEPHYQFPISYFETIVSQLRSELGGKKYKIRIYTEHLNSEEIVESFSNEDDIELHIGENRGQCDYNKIYDIFYHFITSDIHVCSNSGFSTSPGYFRREGVVIYHPHHSFYGLDSPGFLETDENGNFDVDSLNKLL